MMRFFSLPERPKFNISWTDIMQLYIYVGILVILYNTLPNSIWNPQSKQFIAVLGVIGIWRYLWWAVHVIRSIIYRRVTYPWYQLKAQARWNNPENRPKEIFFVIAAYHETQSTMTHCIDSILRECEQLNLTANLFFGTADAKDERLIKKIIETNPRNTTVNAKLIRQTIPGKRVALGLVLRAICRHGVKKNDVIVLMDGDSMVGKDCLKNALPLFLLDNVHALTTNEIPIVEGPTWVRKWFDLRFSQRHMVMQSHALSKRVLTLTGRLSLFRAEHVIDNKFIRTIESDHLNHWLWGDFRFISGDDKSTWYTLLQRQVQMLYVPDAIVYTVDTIPHEGAIGRMNANMVRWSGNMLRNGLRAITLGPSKVPFFIWWCLIDQRIAIWTMLLAPIAITFASLKMSLGFISVYLIWIASTRLILATILSLNIGRLDVTFPLFLYLNQICNAVIKVYLWFRLPKQPWAHRMNQLHLYKEQSYIRTKELVATIMTMVFLLSFGFFVLTYTGLIPQSLAFDSRNFLNVFF